MTIVSPANASSHVVGEGRPSGGVTEPSHGETANGSAAVDATLWKNASRAETSMPASAPADCMFSDLSRGGSAAGVCCSADFGIAAAWTSMLRN